MTQTLEQARKDLEAAQVLNNQAKPHINTAYGRITRVLHALEEKLENPMNLEQALKQFEAKMIARLDNLENRLAELLLATKALQ